MEDKLPKKLGFSFLPIPEELMGSKAISWGAKYLWGIYAKANKEKVRWSANYLAKRMKCTLRETIRRKKELRDNHLIIITPRSGRVDEVEVNLQLIELIQTPDQMDSGQIGQGGDAQNGQGNSKEHSIKETSKEGNPVATIRNFFIEECKKRKGIEPEMAFGKEGKLLKEKLKRYSPEQLMDLADKFLNSEIGERLGWTLSICLSAPVINQWLIGRLEKQKRPYFQGNPMRQRYGKWEVMENGEWLEFAGLESEIIFK